MVIQQSDGAQREICAEAKIWPSVAVGVNGFTINAERQWQPAKLSVVVQLVALSAGTGASCVGKSEVGERVTRRRSCRQKSSCEQAV